MPQAGAPAASPSTTRETSDSVSALERVRVGRKGPVGIRASRGCTFLTSDVARLAPGRRITTRRHETRQRDKLAMHNKTSKDRSSPHLLRYR